MDPNDPAFPKLAAEAYLGRLERHRFLATAVAPSRFVLTAPSDAEPAVAKAEADRDGSGERSEEHFETEHEAALLRELCMTGGVNIPDECEFARGLYITNGYILNTGMRAC